MKFHRILIGTSALLLTIFSVGAAWVIWDRVHTLYPTPETESAFLRSYTPKSVIDQYQCRESSSYGQHSGGGAGRMFVTHTAGFDWHFAMRSERWMPLMNALGRDVAAQLLHNGAEILSRSGDPRSGFHFDYKLGKSIGTVTISPLAINPQIHRGTPLPEGTLDVTAEIELAEKWFPKEPGTIQVSINNPIH
jgi:hypothetical protein